MNQTHPLGEKNNHEDTNDVGKDIGDKQGVLEIEEPESRHIQLPVA